MIGNITFTLHVYYLDLMLRTEGVLTAKQKGCLAGFFKETTELGVGAT